MPRQSRRSSAPTMQKRQAHTVPMRQAPPQRHANTPVATAPAPHANTPAHAPPSSVPATQAPRQPGLFAQMATTAAGVAVGHSMGHAITGAASSLFGGSSSEPEAVPQQQQQQQPAYQASDYQQSTSQFSTCEADSKAFVKCLEMNNNDMGACQWYLENLKACQQMASQY